FLRFTLRKLRGSLNATRRSSLLLHHVTEFVSKETLARVRARRKLSGAKNQIVANCKSVGAHRFGCFSRARVVVNAHSAEVMTKARFHEPTRPLVQRLRRRA